MSKYRMEDGTIVDTDKAVASWKEDTFWDGRNHISKATGDQWVHETLYRSRKGRFYVEHTSQWQGSRAHVEWVSPEEAARWIINNAGELPDELKQYEDEITE